MAPRNQSAIDWRPVLLGLGILLGILVVLGAIDAVADSVRNILVRVGVPREIAGDVGALTFGGIIILLTVVVIRR